MPKLKVWVDLTVRLEVEYNGELGIDLPTEQRLDVEDEISDYISEKYIDKANLIVAIGDDKFTIQDWDWDPVT